MATKSSNDWALAEKRTRAEAKRFLEELLRPFDDQDPSGPRPTSLLSRFSFGSAFHGGMMQELFPHVAGTMPLAEQDLFCPRCGHHDDRWYADYCAQCGRKTTGLAAAASADRTNRNATFCPLPV